VFTSDAVAEMPTKALHNVVSTFEALEDFVLNVTDCEGLVVAVEGGLRDAIHMIDAELQRRPVPSTEQAEPAVEDRRPAERLLTMRELCDHFGYSERWFRYRVCEGMPAHKWGGRHRFSLAEVQEWLGAKYGP
jgi:predicted DNA-binding transcriptional regulator AlpA